MTAELHCVIKKAETGKKSRGHEPNTVAVRAWSSLRMVREREQEGRTETEEGKGGKGGKYNNKEHVGTEEGRKERERGKHKTEKCFNVKERVKERDRR